jgi:CubicO group peptidase (beta-lactamase class C family)
VEALRQVDEWPVDNVAAGVVEPEGIRAWHGDEGREYAWASITKLASALAVLVAAEEGVVDLDEPAGPSGSTVRHLLAHASGLPFEGTSPIARPGERRVYSNAGYEALADHLAKRADMPFEEYLSEAVLTPLDFSGELRGSAAAGLYGTLLDLIDLAREFMRPTLVAPETFAEATSVQFPGLVGVLPDFGRMTPNDWGLGFELRDAKTPHWTGARNSPRTFGHFGGSGAFVWVDPEAQLALAVLTDRPFEDWKDDAKRLWPELSDAVLAEAAQD